MKITSDQQKFLHLAIIEQNSYADIEKEMGVERTQLSKWWEELKIPREELSQIHKIWSKKRIKMDFWKFHEWYIARVLKCHYCGINEEDLSKLRKQGQIFTKRLPTRGRKLEIDRKDPNLPYDVFSNLVLCCYWCNNAKTDEYTELEFKSIGKVIGSIWKKRLTE